MRHSLAASGSRLTACPAAEWGNSPCSAGGRRGRFPELGSAVCQRGSCAGPRNAFPSSFVPKHRPASPRFTHNVRCTLITFRVAVASHIISITLPSASYDSIMLWWKRSKGSPYGSRTAKTVDGAEDETGPPADQHSSGNTGPLVLFPSETEEHGVKFDIVFVHGLRGDRIATWTRDGVCWPRDLLREDLPGARVITWGYDSTVANLLKPASQESIYGHADTLLSDLSNLRREVGLLMIHCARVLLYSFFFFFFC